MKQADPQRPTCPHRRRVDRLCPDGFTRPTYRAEMGPPGVVGRNNSKPKPVCATETIKNYGGRTAKANSALAPPF